jgi:ribosomal protein S6
MCLKVGSFQWSMHNCQCTIFRIIDIMDTDELIKEIIPPQEYKHRNGFSNERFIDSLSPTERNDVENKLIQLLDITSDSLIVETLAYMKSEKALAKLYNLLDTIAESEIALIISASIFKINGDVEMINSAILNFKKIEERKDAYKIYGLISAFYYLIQFQSNQTRVLIEKYINHKEPLVSYNAKTVLGIKD